MYVISYICFSPFLFVQIVEARDVLLQKLREKRDSQLEECDKLKTPGTSEEHKESGVIDGENITSQKNQIKTEKSNAAKGLEIGDTVSTENWFEDTTIDVSILISS